MAVVAMKQLLEAGVHFGHQTRRWDPRMAEYIFQARNGIHIIDLQKTSKKLDEAYAFLKEQAEEGKTVLFVGTKKQAQDCMKEAAEKCGMYYVNQRWLGGMLTNFATIEKRIERLNQLEKMEEDGTFEVLPKKEVILLKKEMEKLEKNLQVAFPEELLIALPADKREALLSALSQDPRPAYQQDGEQYGFEFSGFDVRFSVDGDTLTVFDVTPAGSQKLK